MMCTMIIVPRNHAVGQTYDRPSRGSSERNLLRQFTSSSSSSSTSSLSTSSPSTSLPSKSSPLKLQYHSRYSASVNRFLRAINAKPIKGELDCFEADKDGFAAAFSRLEKSDAATRDLANDYDLRYDVFQDKYLVIRMPEKVDHAAVVTGVFRLIYDHLNDLRNKFNSGTDTYALLDGIMSLGSGAMRISGGHMQPDNQFQVACDDHSPSIVLEIASSQRYTGMQGLHRKLYNLVVDSDAVVKVALGLEINKGKPRLSVWVPKIEPVEHHPHGLLEPDVLLDRKFLAEGGNLELYVKDFVSSDELLATRFPHLDRTAKITIPFAEIIDVVKLAISIRKKRELDDCTPPSKCPKSKYLRRRWDLSMICETLASSGARRTNSVVENQKRPFSSLSSPALGLDLSGNRRLPRSFVSSVNADATCIAMYQPPRLPFGISTTSSGVHQPPQWSTSIGRSLAYIRRVLR